MPTSLTFLPQIPQKSPLFRNPFPKSLDFFGAINIDGCKWCGKSTTAEQFSQSVIKLQDPANKPLIEAAQGQPEIILNGEKPRLIDEWQDFPEIWDAVRTDIDNNHSTGQYILTGSSTPRKNKPRHSGAGRIATIKMRPMSLYESGDSNGSVSLKALFDGAKSISGTARVAYQRKDGVYVIPIGCLKP